MLVAIQQNAAIELAGDLTLPLDARLLDHAAAPLHTAARTRSIFAARLPVIASCDIERRRTRTHRRMVEIHREHLLVLAQQLDGTGNHEQVFGYIALGHMPEELRLKRIIERGAIKQNHVGVFKRNAERQNTCHDKEALRTSEIEPLPLCCGMPVRPVGIAKGANHRCIAHNPIRPLLQRARHTRFGHQQQRRNGIHRHRQHRSLPCQTLVHPHEHPDPERPGEQNAQHRAFDGMRERCLEIPWIGILGPRVFIEKDQCELKGVDEKPGSRNHAIAPTRCHPYGKQQRTRHKRNGKERTRIEKPKRVHACLPASKPCFLNLGNAPMRLPTHLIMRFVQHVYLDVA